MVKNNALDLGKIFRRAGWLALVESVLLGVLGFILVLWPEGTLSVIAWIIGLFLVALGVYKIIDYFAVRGMYDVTNNQLLYGVIALLIGIVIIMLQGEIAGFIRIVIGIWMVYAALVRMNSAIKLRTVGVSSWAYVLLVAALMLVVGIFVLFNSGAIMTLVGWAMLITAALGLVDDVIYLHRVDKVAEEFKKLRKGLGE